MTVPYSHWCRRHWSLEGIGESGESLWRGLNQLIWACRVGWKPHCT